MGGCLWAAFVVPLGDKTLAEHVDAIGETPEAEHLLEGARGTINPALDEVKDRILGEHVTAPTHLAAEEGTDAPGEVTSSADGQPSLPAPDATPSGERDRDDDEPAGIYASEPESPDPSSLVRDDKVFADAPAPRAGGPSTADRVRLPGAR